MKQTLVLAACLSLAACDSVPLVPTTGCKSMDWYEYGYRDGSATGRTNFEEYVRSCSGPFGATPDLAAYKRGLADGQWDKENRSF